MALQAKRNCIVDKSLKIIKLIIKNTVLGNAFGIRKYNFLRTYNCNTNLANLRTAVLSP